MLAEHLNIGQKVIYWSPTLKRYVLEVVKKKYKENVHLENDVTLLYKNIVAIQGE